MFRVKPKSVVYVYKSVLNENRLDSLQELLHKSTIYRDMRSKQRQNLLFTDETFPPVDESLIGFGECEYIALNKKRMIWLRPRDFRAKASNWQQICDDIR